MNKQKITREVKNLFKDIRKADHYTCPCGCKEEFAIDHSLVTRIETDIMKILEDK